MLTRALRTKKLARPAGGDSDRHRDFDPWEFFESHGAVVNAKKKTRKRGRCSLCARRAVVGHRPVVHLHNNCMDFDPGREVQKKYGKCTKITGNDPS